MKKAFYDEDDNDENLLNLNNGDLYAKECECWKWVDNLRGHQGEHGCQGCGGLKGEKGSRGCCDSKGESRNKCDKCETDVEEKGEKGRVFPNQPLQLIL